MEVKYLIPEQTWETLAREVSGRLNQDEFTKKTGSYDILNIYYDSQDFVFHSAMIDRRPFRQKVRMRAYGRTNMTDRVYLEIKNKYKDRTYKRRCGISLAEGYRFMADNSADSVLTPSISGSGTPSVTNQQILNEIRFLRDHFVLIPRAFISYTREAFVGSEDPSLRLTVDHNILGRNHELAVESGPGGDSLLPPETCLLEIKVRNSIPLWLSEQLTRNRCFPAGFSKYTQYCNSFRNEAFASTRQRNAHT